MSQFIVDETTGKITGYKTEIGGADTVFPFRGFHEIDIVSSRLTYTVNLGFKPKLFRGCRVTCDGTHGIISSDLFKITTGSSEGNISISANPTQTYTILDITILNNGFTITFPSSPTSYVGKWVIYAE